MKTINGINLTKNWIIKQSQKSGAMESFKKSYGAMLWLVKFAKWSSKNFSLQTWFSSTAPRMEELHLLKQPVWTGKKIWSRDLLLIGQSNLPPIKNWINSRGRGKVSYLISNCTNFLPAWGWEKIQSSMKEISNCCIEGLAWKIQSGCMGWSSIRARTPKLWWIQILLPKKCPKLKGKSTKSWA